MDQWIIQGVGYLALFFFILSFQNNNRVRLLLLMLTGMLVFIVHYALLGAWTGALMNAVGAAMVFVSYKKETATWAQRAVWPYVFMALFIVVGILTAKTWADLLPAAGQVFTVFAIWQTNARSIRFLMLVPRPLWMVYNIVVGSQAGILVESFITVSVLVSIVRFDIVPLIPGLKEHNSKKFMRWFRRKDSAI